MPFVLIGIGVLVALSSLTDRYWPADLSSLRPLGLAFGGGLVLAGVLAWGWERWLEHGEEVERSLARKAKANAKMVTEAPDQPLIDMNKPISTEGHGHDSL